MKSTITFDGERTGMSSSGNTEWFECKVTSTIHLTERAVRSVCQIHGMDGQSFSCQEVKEGDLFVWHCKATSYSD